MHITAGKDRFTGWYALIGASAIGRSASRLTRD
jgi:hypothetical protein